MMIIIIILLILIQNGIQLGKSLLKLFQEAVESSKGQEHCGKEV